MILSEQDKVKAEKHMSVEDWKLLYTAACVAAVQAPYHEASTKFLELADKCKVRADALKEGRVMP
jgi:hypothetical protein